MQLLVCFLVAFGVGIQVTKFSLYELFSIEGFAGARRLFTSLANPDWRVLPSAVLGIVETIFIAFIATVLAIPVAFVLSFYASKNLVTILESREPAISSKIVGFFFGFGPVKYFALRTVFNIVRSCEPVMWAIIFSVWVGIGPFPGMLALLVHSVASLTKQYSEQIESIERGPVEGIQSTGANSLQVVLYAVVPQVVLPFVAYTLYRWDINVRMATILGLVGAGGIGSMLGQAQGQAAWEEVGALILLIAFVVWIIDMASAYIREAIK
jgi:phosphonate transport system permease protein